MKRELLLMTFVFIFQINFAHMLILIMRIHYKGVAKDDDRTRQNIG